MNGKQLKNSILQWAIQGKLVPQDPSDEPASALLQRIRDEKARLVKEGKIKRDKQESIITRGDDGSFYETIGKTTTCIDDQLPFAIPEGWEWVRLGNIGDWGAGATPNRGNPVYYTNGTIPWLKTGELNNAVVYDSKEKITELALRETSLRETKVGDIMIAMYGATIGKLAIAGTAGMTTNQACCICSPFLTKDVFRNYLFLFLMASRNDFVEMGAGGAQPNISKEKLTKFLFPLPPLAEQGRIVAKIEELLPMVDDYGKAQDELDALNAGIDERLRKSILQWAIQGKLVPQDPSDEPASVLLQRIRDEKARLVKEGKIKRDKQESIITRGDDGSFYETVGKTTTCIDDQLPFTIPEGWEWCRIQDLGLIETGTTPPKTNSENFGGPYPFFKPNDLEQGINTCTSIDSLSEIGYALARKIPKNSILVTCIGSIGKSGLVHEDGSCNQQINAIIPIFVNPKFVYFCCISPMMQESLKRESSATTIAILNKNKFSRLQFPLPPLAEQGRIVAKIEELFRLLKS